MPQPTQHFILIRGLARESRHWLDFPKILQARFPDAEIELLDHAGNGSEIHRTSATNITETVEDLRRRSRLVQENKKPILVAVSLGAMITTTWASLYPQEISGLVLMNTSDGSTAHAFERLLPGAQLNIFKVLTKKEPYDIELACMPIISNRVEKYKDWAKAFSLIPRTSGANLTRQLLSAFKVHFPKTPPRTPILLLTTYGDKMVSWRCSQKISQMWNLPLEIHPDAGHDITLDAPEWVVDRIQVWATQNQNLPFESPSTT